MDFDLAELFANLTPQGQESLLWNSRGHVPQVGEMAIAYGLGKVKTKGAGYLIRVKYALEDAWWGDLDFELWLVMTKIASKRKWPPTWRKDWLRNLGRMAIFENVHHHVCPTCQGRGSAIIESKIVLCETCGGVGRKTMDDETRAKVMGVTPELFADWSINYRRIQNVVQGWEMDALTRFKEAFRHECHSELCKVCNKSLEIQQEGETI